jgi:CO dehydrogenase/acetyl-CoA synthase gamma subunit (corrinoid Fe-S protein)
MMEQPSTLIFKGDTMEMSTVDGNEVMFKYKLSGMYTTFSGVFINLKNTMTDATFPKSLLSM